MISECSECQKDHLFRTDKGICGPPPNVWTLVCPPSDSSSVHLATKMLHLCFSRSIQEIVSAKWTCAFRNELWRTFSITTTSKLSLFQLPLWVMRTGVTGNFQSTTQNLPKCNNKTSFSILTQPTSEYWRLADEIETRAAIKSHQVMTKWVVTEESKLESFHCNEIKSNFRIFFWLQVSPCFAGRKACLSDFVGFFCFFFLFLQYWCVHAYAHPSGKTISRTHCLDLRQHRRPGCEWIQLKLLPHV